MYDLIIKNGLILVFATALIIEFLLITFNAFIRKPLRLDPVGQTSLIYSNAGNLIIPLVTAILGKEWVIYTSGLLLVQLVLLFVHARPLLCGERGFQARSLFSNPNIYAIFAGIALFFARVRLPGLLQDTVDTLGGMIGPVSMLITGMLIGDMDFKKILGFKRVWLVAFFRLIAAPLLVLVFLKYSGIATLVENGKQILLVTFLATTTPAASTITQFAQVYDKDAPYASAINVVTTLLCILTIPVMVILYQL